MKETELFHPIKTYLEGQGYAVHSEVRNCDLVARRGDELIIVEIKVQLSLKLVIQGVSRQEMYPNVYLAVPVSGRKNLPANIAAARRLLRRLGLGLILVRFIKTKVRVEIALHPDEPRKFNRPRSSRMIISEIDGRYSEFNRSGEPATTEKLTAYKQQCIAVAYALSELGSSTPAGLRSRGLPAKTQQILSSNYYGWFDRVERGVYALNQRGVEALAAYPQVIEAAGESLDLKPSQGQ
jgi:hypothetical protein